MIAATRRPGRVACPLALAEAYGAMALVTSLPMLISTGGVEPIATSNRAVGGLAERMLLVPVPNGLDPRHAALTGPMAVGLHASVNNLGGWVDRWGVVVPRPW